VDDLFVFTENAFDCGEAFAGSETPVHRLQFDSSKPVVETSMNAGSDFLCLSGDEILANWVACHVFLRAEAAPFKESWARGWKLPTTPIRISR
jgi:hypothetical protein